MANVGGVVRGWPRGVRELLARGLRRPLVVAEVPGPLGREVLSFTFIALAEYWLAPAFVDLTNYAGVWSEAGVALFALFVAALLLFAVRPLVGPLTLSLQGGARWGVFLALWAGGILLALVATHSLQWGEGPRGNYLGPTTVYTPFGQWTALAFSLAVAPLSGTIVPVDLVTLGLLGFLWSSAVVLGLEARRRGSCAVRPARGTWGARLAGAFAWGPIGFLSSCSACTPAYLAVLGVLAPGLAANGYAALPLVPWIGFAGLLYLVSFSVVLYQVRSATRRLVATGTGSVEGAAR